ncbi:MAG: hypothetical protein GY910_16135, partial [bacterium]|nr:hypothetical protein [bacterium]
MARTVTAHAIFVDSFLQTTKERSWEAAAAQNDLGEDRLGDVVVGQGIAADLRQIVCGQGAKIDYSHFVRARARL